MKTNGPGWPLNMRTSKPGWQKKWMPPSPWGLLWHKLSQLGQTKPVRLIPWCISTTANPDVIPIHHLSEALTTAMQPGVDALAVTPAPGSEGSQALALQAVLHASLWTPSPPILPLSGRSLYWYTPSNGHSLVRVPHLIPSITKWDHSPSGAPDMINLGRGPMPKPLKPKPAVGTAHHRVATNHPKCHSEVHDNGMGAPKSTKSTTVGTALITSGDESTQDELRENAADSDLESGLRGLSHLFRYGGAQAIRMAWKRFQKRVWASCSITRGCLWSEAQVRQIKDSYQAIWDSDHEIVRTE